MNTTEIDNRLWRKDLDINGEILRGADLVQVVDLDYKDKLGDIRTVRYADPTSGVVLVPHKGPCYDGVLFRKLSSEDKQRFLESAF